MFDYSSCAMMNSRIRYSYYNTLFFIDASNNFVTSNECYSRLLYGHTNGQRNCDNVSVNPLGIFCRVNYFLLVFLFNFFII